MGTAPPSNTYSEIARLLKGTPVPLAPEVLDGNTRITADWRNPPFAGDVPALNEHCLVRHAAGHSHSLVKIGGKVSAAEMVPGTISVVPKGQASWRRSSSVMEVSNLYLA